MTDDKQEPHEQSPNEQPSEQSRLLAMLALQLRQERQSNGLKPSMDEIWAWMHGELGETRSQEVKSHIARDPAIYSLWHDLRTTRAEVEATDMQVDSEATMHDDDVLVTQSAIDPELDKKEFKSDAEPTESGLSLSTVVQTLSKWFQPRPLVGFATAVVVGSVFIKVIQPTPSHDYWQDWQNPKSNAIADSVVNDVDALQSVLAGMNSAMRELSIPALSPEGQPLPRQMPACTTSTEDAECIATREALHTLGQLVVEVRLICLTRYPVPESKIERLSSLAEVLIGTEEGRPFEGPVRDWLESEEDREQCAAVNTIVERALRGLAN